ncbi:hypothetical protein ACSQ67_020682 [Phaseolus vulgaris]
MIQVFASSESCDVSLPGDNDPYWLAYMGDGHSVYFTVPQDRVVKGMALCVVYLSTSEIIEPELSTVLIVNYTKCTCQIHNHGTVISFNDEDWPDIMSNLGSGDKVEIFGILNLRRGGGLVPDLDTAHPGAQPDDIRVRPMCSCAELTGKLERYEFWYST